MASLKFWLRSFRLRWIRFKYYLNGYVKIRYKFLKDEQEDFFDSETVWSKPLGDNLYRIENIPEFIEELNLHDVVRCQENPDELPTIVEIVCQSGNRTLRLEFRKETPAEIAVNALWDLREKQISYEKAGVGRYILNIEPNID